MCQTFQLPVEIQRRQIHTLFLRAGPTAHAAPNGPVFLREPFDGGMLYTPGLEDRCESPEKAAYYFRSAFLCDEPEAPTAENLLADKLRFTPTTACLDFTGTTADLAFNLTPIQGSSAAPAFETKYELVPLGQVVEILNGGTPSTKIEEYWRGDIPWLSVADFRNKPRYVDSAEKSITEAGLENSSTQILRAGDVIISARGTVGEIAQLAKPMAFNQSCYGLRGKEGVDNAFLLFTLRMITGEMKARSSGATFGSITTRTLKSFRIPLPPLSVQQHIVQEIEKVEEEETLAKNTIATTKAGIQSLLDAAIQSTPVHQLVGLSKLAQVNPPKFTEGLTEESKVSFIDMAAVSDTGGLLKVEERSYKEVKVGYTNFMQGDVLLAKITPCMENGKIAYLETLPYVVGFGSTEFFVIRAKDALTARIIFHFLNRDAFRQVAAGAMTGASGHRRVPKSFLEKYEIPQLEDSQKRHLLKSIEDFEAQCIAAETVLAAAPERKRKILLDGLK